MTDLKEELWKLAVLVAMSRLGILPMLRNEEGAWIPPTGDVAADPAGTRKARRKYRKLWRRNLAREFREFEVMPKRRQKQQRYCGTYIKGRWRTDKDPVVAYMLRTLTYEVGRNPRRHARGKRWNIVKVCPEFRAVLKQVAKEFGLLDPRRNI